MPRIKTSPKKCIKNGPSSSPSPNSWIFLLNDDALEENTGIVQLRHPNTDGPGMFLCSANDTVIQEVQTFSESKRSWFIEESVKSDGKLLLTTPIDPLFLVLPYLVKMGRCVPLDQAIDDCEFPQTHRLLNALTSSSLSHIADRKGPEEFNAWQFSEEKTLIWLKNKTERVAEMLQTKNMHVGPMAISNTFITSQQENPENYLKYALGIISEYLSEDISSKLSKFLGISMIEPDHKRKKTEITNCSDAKRPKLEPISSPESELNTSAVDLSKTEKLFSTPKPSVTMKEKARVKAAQGSKSISSFFKKA